MIRQLLFTSTALAALFIGGCEIYIEPDPAEPPSDCGPWGCDAPAPQPGEPGGDCRVDDDCMAGCFCNDENWCEETGFCDNDFQCPDGYVCDDRATCVPDNGAPAFCESDDQCPVGSFCWEEFGECVETWTCWGGDECGPGMTCDDRGTCVPVPCDDDTDCAEGCFCDPESGECVETGFCETDRDCTAMGLDGYLCDDRATCVPPESRPDPGACYGEITCERGAPACAEGSTPAIAEGCYTGECVPLDQCKEEPLPTCDQLETEDVCFARPDCSASYIGVDCTCEGGSSCRCTSEDTNCTCASYEYAGCISL